MTMEGDEDIEGGLRKFLDTRKGGSEKIRGQGGLRKFVYFKANRTLPNCEIPALRYYWASTSQSMKFY